MGDASVSESLQSKLTSTADVLANAQIEGGMNKFDDTMKKVLKNLGNHNDDSSPLVAVAVVVQLADQVTGHNDGKPSGVQVLSEERPNTASMNFQIRIDKVSSDIGIEGIIDYEKLPKKNKISALEEQMYGEKQEGGMRIRLEKLETDSL